MRRKILRLTGFVGELLALHNMSKGGCISGAVVSTQNFLNMVYYRLLSEVFSFSVVLNLVELQKTMTQNGSVLAKVNAFLLDHYAPRLAHGLLPISEFLTARARGSPQANPCSRCQ